MKPSTLPLCNWKSGIIRVNIFVLICVLVCRILMETLSRNSLLNPRVTGWILSLLGLRPAFLPISFKIPTAAPVPCSLFVWLEVCGVNWNCSERSPSASSPISDLISDLPTHKVSSPKIHLVTRLSGPAPLWRWKGATCHILVAAPLAHKEECNN